MICTAELRFVEREIVSIVGIKKYRVLQQKWQDRYWQFDEAGNKSQPEEWRDVPLVKEEA